MVDKIIESVYDRITSLSIACCRDERESELKEALLKENEKFIDLIQEWYPNKFSSDET